MNKTTNIGSGQIIDNYYVLYIEKANEIVFTKYEIEHFRFLRFSHNLIFNPNLKINGILNSQLMCCYVN